MFTLPFPRPLVRFSIDEQTDDDAECDFIVGILLETGGCFSTFLLVDAIVVVDEDGGFRDPFVN